MSSNSTNDITRQLQDPAQRTAAFTQLVEQHKEKLYWQIRRMVLSHDDADDILQNTFIKAWTALDTFRGDAQPSSWLYRIAHNETINHLEQQRAMLSIDDDNAQALAASLAADPYFDGDETELQLQQAIATLPDRQREVFNLRYFGHQHYEDISQALGISIGALKASYHLAVHKITAFFNSHD